MDLKQLRYFMAIVEERQITAAARRLHMAQPPLSNQMKMLEDEIGLKLFQRGPHHIELTEAGNLLAARAAQLLDMAAMTKRELKDFRQGLCGTLAIGTVSSSGGILMHEGMQAFRAEFPRVHFEIHAGRTNSTFGGTVATLRVVTVKKRDRRWPSPSRKSARLTMAPKTRPEFSPCSMM